MKVPFSCCSWRFIQSLGCPNSAGLNVVVLGTVAAASPGSLVVHSRPTSDILTGIRNSGKGALPALVLTRLWVAGSKVWEPHLQTFPCLQSHRGGLLKCRFRFCRVLAWGMCESHLNKFQVMCLADHCIVSNRCLPKNHSEVVYKSECPGTTPHQINHTRRKA